jgi:hypothetical protein
VIEPLRTARGNQEDAKPLGLVILVSLIELHLATPTVEAAAQPHRLRPIIDLHEKGESQSRIRSQLEGTIGIQTLVARLQAKRVLAVEAVEAEAVPVGTDRHVDEHLGEGLGVCLPGDADRPDEAACRWSGILAVQEAVAERP